MCLLKFMESLTWVVQDPFPLKAICGSVWKNIEGQISFLKYAVSAPPEVFTFAHSGRQLVCAIKLGILPFLVFLVLIML